RQRAAPCGPPRNARDVAMRFAFARVRHEILRLEIAKDGEHRRVREVGGGAVGDLGDRPRSEIPQHAPCAPLAGAEHEIVHCSPVYYWSSSVRAMDRLVNYPSSSFIDS